MSIVPLSCPKCCGSLEVDEFATKAKCPFCGTEHVVHNDGSGAVELEFHARCPRCKRNDQVKAVTAIQREGSNLATKLALPEIKGVQDTPSILTKWELRIDALRVVLAPSCWLILAILIIGYLLSLEHTKGAIFFGIISILGTSGYIWLNRDKFRYFKEKIVDRERVISEINRSNMTLQSKHQILTQYWNRLYYCARDDCVFLPGLMKSASPINLTKFLEDLVSSDTNTSEF